MKRAEFRKPHSAEADNPSARIVEDPILLGSCITMLTYMSWIIPYIYTFLLASVHHRSYAYLFTFCSNFVKDTTTIDAVATHSKSAQPHSSESAMHLCPFINSHMSQRVSEIVSAFGILREHISKAVGRKAVFMVIRVALDVCLSLWIYRKLIISSAQILLRVLEFTFTTPPKSLRSRESRELISVSPILSQKRVGARFETQMSKRRPRHDI